MSGRAARDPRPVVERLVPEAFAGSRHSPVMSTFLRGVTTGALVGAAIAGSALLQRRRAQQEQAKGPPPEAPAAADGARDRAGA